MQEDFKLGQLFSVQGKSALITGGSSGLGFNMAKGLLQNGVRVIIASRSRGKCDSALAELQEFGNCIAICADVTDREQRRRLVSQVGELEAGNGLNILINNAGTNWGASLEDYPDQGFEKVVNTNLNAVFSLTRDLVPLLAKAGTIEDPARIINIGSMDGLQVPVVQRVPTFAYSASKAALHHLTRALAVDLASRHITVNAVAPGFFESKMTDHVLANYRQDIEADCPLGRIGQPAEIVGIIVYLASRAGNYTNGTVIPVDGGTSISKGARPWSGSAP
ncbi:MAG: SDR family oxidoreductase [Gammaproteobacteria bacterium]|nr:SDR family oxidoreductase [Pseudomonadales bacterium]MCP5345773.1 SDR family oxidoreductase [Pseudomonadales bacterium]